MRVYFAILNTSLLFIALAFAIITNTLFHNTTVVKMPSSINKTTTTPVPTQSEKQEMPLAQIYGRRDLFGLYSSTPGTVKSVFSSEVPTLTLPTDEAAPPQPFTPFIEPLTIMLNGIIFSSNEEDSVCIFADETEKEKMYRLGDPLGDAHIVKIGRDRVVFLRASGQLETFYLNEVDEDAFSQDYTSIVSKKSDVDFSINLTKINKRIHSLSELLEHVPFIPLFKDGKLNKILLDQVEPKSLADCLGLKFKDQLLAVGGNPILEEADPLRIYKKIMTSGLPNTLELEILREGKTMKIQYTLEKNTHKVTKSFSQYLAELGGKTEQASATPDLNSQQAQVLSNNSTTESLTNNNTSSTAKQNNEERYKENIEAIRKKLMARMQNRSR